MKVIGQIHTNVDKHNLKGYISDIFIAGQGFDIGSPEEVMIIHSWIAECLANDLLIGESVELINARLAKLSLRKYMEKVGTFSHECKKGTALGLIPVNYTGYDKVVLTIEVLPPCGVIFIAPRPTYFDYVEVDVETKDSVVIRRSAPNEIKISPKPEAKGKVLKVVLNYKETKV